MRCALVLMLALVCLGCKSNAPETPVATQLPLGAENDFIDLALRAEKSADGTIKVRTDIDGKSVGFDFKLGSKFRRQKIDEGVFMFVGGGEILSIGPQSDAFLSWLARQYKLPPVGRMRKSVKVDAIGLQDDPSHIDGRSVNLKLFFSPDSETDYAEAYLNFDLPNGKAEFNEKDPEYRKGLLASLRAK